MKSLRNYPFSSSPIDFFSRGAGLPSSYLTGLGACAGVLFYYLFLQNYLCNQRLDNSSLVLQQLSSFFQSNQFSLNVAMGTIFVSAAFLLDYFLPYESELKDLPIKLSWSPVWSGVGIGLLQLFFMVLFDKSLGISTGFSVLVAQLNRLEPLQDSLPSLKSFTDGLANKLALLFSLAAVAGSFLATLARHEFPLNNRYGGSMWSSFLGGFLLLVGARCAGGCTSGQGISGKETSPLPIVSIRLSSRCDTSSNWFTDSYSIDVWWWYRFCLYICSLNQRLAFSIDIDSQFFRTFLNRGRIPSVVHFSLYFS